jgi:hypothetical protein
VCDGKDNDCDGKVDEEIQGATCDKVKGVCARAKKACVAGAFETICTDSSYGPDFETVETRCDAKDNDCDGQVDEGILGPACEKTLGVCASARQRCIATTGAFESPCANSSYGRDYEGTETRCDGLDNNCDGRTDEGLDEDGDGVGETANCPKGTQDCDDTDPARSPMNREICDGKDNNCDGKVDEGFFCAQGTAERCATSCGTIGGKPCNATCTAYEPTCVNPQEICNGLDDDCDGEVDKGLNSGLLTVSASGVDAGRSSAVGVPPGGGFFAYSQNAKAQPGSPAVLVRPLDRASLGGTPLVVATPAGSLGGIAVSADHVMWVEKSSTSGSEIKAATLSKGPQPAASAPFSVDDSTSRVFEGLVARDRVGKGTLLAWLAVPSIAGNASQIRIATLKGRQRSTRADFDAPVGVTFRAPALGVVGSFDLIYYLRTDGTGKAKIAARIIDTVGEARREGVAPLFSEQRPAPAKNAIAYSEASSCTGCNGRRRIALSRVQLCSGMPCPGKTLSTLTDPTKVDAHSPALAQAADDVYLVAWLEVDSGGGNTVSAVRVTYDGVANDWTVSIPLGLQSLPRSFTAVGVATDGARFGLFFDTAVNNGFGDVRYRNTCP